MQKMEFSSHPTRVRELDCSDREFLENFMFVNPFPENDDGLAIYARSGCSFYFVEDALIPSGKSGAFAKIAPKNFYRAGACGVIRTSHGMLAVTDERRSWYKPFPAGLASRNEGGNLIQTFNREFWEEVWVFDHLKRTAHYVPAGGQPKLSCKGLDITVKETLERGTLRPLGHFANETENTAELHVEWDITGVEPISVYYDEDWFSGGLVGVPVVAIDEKGQVSGWYAGQQGFVKPTPAWGLHPAVQAHALKC